METQAVGGGEDAEDVEGDESEGGAKDDPLEPGVLDVDAGALREVDTEEHEAEGHGGLAEGGPDEAEGEEKAGVEGGVQEQGADVAEDAEDEPGVGAAGAGPGRRTSR